MQEARKKLHVDEIEVVDSVDTSTSLCLYIMLNYVIIAVNFGGIHRLELSFLYLGFSGFFW